MANLHVILPFHNERSVPVTVYLEPIPEWFTIKPGQRIEVHGVCDANTSNLNFTVDAHESGLTFHAPGYVPGFVDCYVTCDGVRLVPDGN